MAHKINYSFNKLSEAELNGITTYLNKNVTQFFTRLVMAMGIQDQINSI